MSKPHPESLREARSGDASALVIHVDRMGDAGWECDVWIEGRSYGGGTAPTASGALDVAMDILYGDTNDHLNGDHGAIRELEESDA